MKFHQILSLTATVFLLFGCGGYIESGSDSNHVLLEGSGFIINDLNSHEKADKYCKNEGKYQASLQNKFTNQTTGHLHYIYSCLSMGDIERQKKAEEERMQAFVEKEAQEKKHQADKRAREIDIEDNKLCVSYGLKKGTKNYANCRIKLYEERDRREASRKSLEIQTQQVNYEAQVQQQKQAQQAAAQQALIEQQHRQQSNIETMQLLQIYQATQPKYYTPPQINCTTQPIGGGISQTNCY